MNMLLEKSRLTTLYRHPFFVFFCTAGLLVIASMLLSSCGGNATAAPTSTAAQSTVARKNVSIPIKVYFSKSPESTQNDLTAVFPVDRISPTTGVATYAIQLLIAGPTTEERDAGYYSLLNSMFSGSSTCGFAGPDFQLTLNKKGTTAEQGTATVKFCRQTSSSGIGTDASVSSEINATLKQFSNIKKVVILLQSGHCFGDESGLDRCLQ